MQEAITTPSSLLRHPAAKCSALGLLVCALALTPRAARADQPQDYMVGVQPEGTLLMVDTIFPGIQATLQHNLPIYGQANMARFRVNSLLTFPFYESQVDAEIRLVVLTLGLATGFRDVFRTLQFDADNSMSRGARRGLESDTNFTTDRWGFIEARAELSLPMNDTVVFYNRNAFRFEGRPESTFDYRTGVVHDGRILQSDVHLFFKHPDWGAIAPSFQMLHFKHRGSYKTVNNVGVMAVTRAGLMRRDDLFLVQAWVHPSGALGGRDAGAVYGAQAFYGPWSALVAYRVTFELSDVVLR